MFQINLKPCFSDFCNPKPRKRHQTLHKSDLNRQSYEEITIRAGIEPAHDQGYPLYTPLLQATGLEMGHRCPKSSYNLVFRIPGPQKPQQRHLTSYKSDLNWQSYEEITTPSGNRTRVRQGTSKPNPPSSRNDPINGAKMLQIMLKPCFSDSWTPKTSEKTPNFT